MTKANLWVLLFDVGNCNICPYKEATRSTRLIDKVCDNLCDIFGHLMELEMKF